MDRPVTASKSSLHLPALVLNRSWMPVHVTTVHRALCMIYRGNALVVAPDTLMTHDFEDWTTLPEPPTQKFVRTGRMPIPVPEVILVRRYSRVPALHAPFTRRNLLHRDDHQCQYCGRRCTSDKLSIDHVTPRSRGGTTTWENCVLACVRCNSRKGNKTPKQAGLNLLRLPARPRWSPYLNLPRGARRDSWQQFGPEAFSKAGRA